MKFWNLAEQLLQSTDLDMFIEMFTRLWLERDLKEIIVTRIFIPRMIHFGPFSSILGGGRGVNLKTIVT